MLGFASVLLGNFAQCFGEDSLCLISVVQLDQFAACQFGLGYGFEVIECLPPWIDVKLSAQICFSY